MLNDSSKMDEPDYRDEVFLSVFNNPEGQMVLDYLESQFRVILPDTANSNDVYFKLGKLNAVYTIRNVLSNAKEKK